jgi:hypothetical protein
MTSNPVFASSLNPYVGVVVTVICSTSLGCGDPSLYEAVIAIRLLVCAYDYPALGMFVGE